MKIYIRYSGQYRTYSLDPCLPKITGNINFPADQFPLVHQRLKLRYY